MMSNVYHVVKHVVRRGLDTVPALPMDDPELQMPQIPAWAMAAFVGLTVAFVVALAVVEYSWAHVVATLTMIETPAAVLFEPIVSDEPDFPLDSKDEKAEKESLFEPELLLVKQKPITSSIRATMKHLRAGGCRLAAFRGLGTFCLVNVCTMSCTNLLSDTLPVSIPFPVAAIISAVTFAGLRLYWVHLVMTVKNTESRSFGALCSLPAKQWVRANAFATFANAACQQGAACSLIMSYKAMGMDKYTPETVSQMPCAEHKMIVVKVISLALIALFNVLFLVIPAQIAMTRVQASLLTVEDTVVPFDRTFGGKVIPRSEGGSGIVSFTDAAKSISWATRLRLYRLYFKVGAMQVATTMTYFGLVLVLVGMIIKPEDLQKGMTLMQAAMASESTPAN